MSSTKTSESHLHKTTYVNKSSKHQSTPSKQNSQVEISIDQSNHMVKLSTPSSTNKSGKHASRQPSLGEFINKYTHLAPITCVGHEGLDPTVTPRIFIEASLSFNRDETQNQSN